MDIRIRIVPNPLYGTPGSLVENAYKGEVIHTGTVTAADICEACKQENPQMTEPLASLATETIMDYGSDKVVTDVVRFNLGSAYFTMEPAVSGSVPTVDAALTDANERYIRVVNGPSLNARIAALRPVITGDDLGDVQFHSTEAVRDDGEFKNTLFGDEEFVALGKRLGGADQRMELVAADGTTVSAATFLGGLNPIGTIFASFFIQHITAGGAYVDKSIYCSQVSDLISSLIIYLCAFVLFLKTAMNRWIFLHEERKSKKAAKTEKGGEA